MKKYTKQEFADLLNVEGKRELKQRIENAHRIRDNISTCDERLCFYWHMLIKFGFQGIHSSSIS
ncbi:hypothetical protein, partial [Dubosiella newyorkensis]|uniref:hypothetical protein n=1 Tax=Dubosiella newyorkensis TaxID=1862672 RepID=UPI00272D7D66